jgi:hypothetical protein
VVSDDIVSPVGWQVYEVLRLRTGRFGRDRGSPDRPALDGDPAEDLPRGEIRLRIHSRIRDYSYLGAGGFQPRKRDFWHGISIQFW